MKRLREDGKGSQVKRPASSRGKMAASERFLPAPANTQRLTTVDALAYLTAVKEIFKDDKERYDEFLIVTKDFKAQTIDTAGAIMRVNDLFKGHHGLILGFNAFLPEGFDITIPAEEEIPKKQPMDLDQAINYVKKIKTRFSSDEHVYKSFLEMLRMYHKGNKSISEVCQEVAFLFIRHADLLEEFTHFLPDSSGPVNSSVTLGNPSFRSEENSTGLTDQVMPRPEEKIVKKNKLSPCVDRDRGSERLGVCIISASRFLEEEKRLSKSSSLQKEQLAFFDKVKRRLSNRDIYQEFLKCLKIFTQEIIGRSELQSLVANILGKHSDLMEGFNDLFSDCEILERYNAGVLSSKNEREKERDRVDFSAQKEGTCQKASSLLNKEKHSNKSVSELDLSNGERITTTDQLLPRSRVRRFPKWLDDFSCSRRE